MVTSSISARPVPTLSEPSFPSSTPVSDNSRPVSPRTVGDTSLEPVTHGYANRCSAIASTNLELPPPPHHQERQVPLSYTANPWAVQLSQWASSRRACLLSLHSQHDFLPPVGLLSGSILESDPFPATPAPTAGPGANFRRRNAVVDLLPSPFPRPGAQGYELLIKEVCHWYNL
ncbi:uncharacterized protein BJX67DRAFT_386743 [Aspergillus lucknowensis]|uniref:Uncharacterized protein n=1 Tax=Aspergillus lucknowensis TaxID=176173 RepID=A0ABR4L3G7_9EURO